MTTMEVKERVQNKALSKLLKLERDIDKYNSLLDKGDWKLSQEQIRLVIRGTEKDVEVWKFILNSAQ